MEDCCRGVGWWTIHSHITLYIFISWTLSAVFTIDLHCSSDTKSTEDGASYRWLFWSIKISRPPPPLSRTSRTSSGNSAHATAH